MTIPKKIIKKVHIKAMIAMGITIPSTGKFDTVCWKGSFSGFCGSLDGTLSFSESYESSYC